MANNTASTSQRATRLGRSSITGQFVLRPVGKPTNVKRTSVGSEAVFTVSDRLVLSLAAKRLPSREIAQRLSVPQGLVVETLERAKRHYKTETRFAAARKFIQLNKHGGAAG